MITTTEELDALPSGSVILGQFPSGAFEKCDMGWWGAGSHIVYQVGVIPLPGKVLWTPKDGRP